MCPGWPGPAAQMTEPCVPFAARRDPKLHDLLSLVDTLRIGRARDRALAAAELRACIWGASSTADGSSPSWPTRYLRFEGAD